MPCRNAATLLVFLILFAIVTAAQKPAATTSYEIPIDGSHGTWPVAKAATSPKRRVLVVSVDRPTHFQSCHIQTLSADRLVCSRAFGGSRTYMRREVVALILPRIATKLDRGLWLLGRGELAAAIVGTVLLAPTCPACAAGTAFAALYVFFGIPFTEGELNNRVLYLTPGQPLSRKLGFIQGP